MFIAAFNTSSSVSMFHVPLLNTVRRRVCETQMPPIMANSKDGQGHKDKYFDTSRRLCHKKCWCAISKHHHFTSYDQCQFSKEIRSNVKVKRFNTNRKILSLGIFMRNMESLISKILMVKTVEKLLHCSKVQTPRLWSQGQKCWYLRKGVVTRNTHVI